MGNMEKLNSAVFVVKKNASGNGNFPTTLLTVCNAKYMFKSPEWRRPKAGQSGLRIPTGIRNLYLLQNLGTTSLLFQWVQGGLSHR